MTVRPRGMRCQQWKTGLTLWQQLQLHLCPCCGILTFPAKPVNLERPLPACMQVPPGTMLVGMDESWKQTLFSSYTSMHSHDSMLYRFWDLYPVHKSHRPFPPCSTCCSEKWRSWRNRKCRNSTGVKWQGAEGAEEEWDPNFIQYEHHSHLTASDSISLMGCPLLTTCTEHHYFTKFGDHKLMEGKEEASKDLEKVHRRC